MRTGLCLTLAFAMLTVEPNLAQSSQIKEMEQSLEEKKGVDYVDAALELSALLLKEKRQDAALGLAEKAYFAAKKLALRDRQALALLRRGQATAAQPSKLNLSKAKGYKLMEDGLAMAEDPSLKREILEGMKSLANDMGRRREVRELERKLALLRGEKLEEEVDSLSRQQALLLAQQAQLEGMVKEKENAIRSMTTEQMRRELLLAGKERLLDSLRYSSALDSMKLAQSELQLRQQAAELSARESELALRNSQRKFFVALAALGLLLAGGLFYRYRVTREHNLLLAQKNEIIEEERRRSENLLLNILPFTVAEELKRQGFAAARRYEEATVLFADFVGFSRLSKQMPPEELVSTLDHAFKHFDRIVGQYKLEKIKTIGDAYMCAGGVPAGDGEHPGNMVRAALDIQQFLSDWNRERLDAGKPAFEARIGIHTGPVVAGVVGNRKFAYDIWGETVNVAARMESNGEPGRVNISSSTYHRVKDVFRCSSRGRIAARNVGEIEMYFVERA